MFEKGQKVMFYVYKLGKWLNGVIESENKTYSKEVGYKCYDVRQTEPIVVCGQSFNGHLYVVEITSIKTLDGKKAKLSPKQKLIQRINRLGFSDVLYGYDKEGKLININEYNIKKDLFYGYDEQMRTLSFKFEDLPKKLVKC